MAANIAGDFAATGRVAYQRHVLQIEGFNDGGQILGIAVHIVSFRGLARSSVAAAVMRDHAETVLREEEHLTVPGVRAQWPAVREHYDRPLAPVFVINLRSILGFDCTHRSCSFYFVRVAVNGTPIAPTRTRGTSRAEFNWGLLSTAARKPYTMRSNSTGI